MAAPDTIWEIVVGTGWYTSTTSPPGDEPVARQVSKYFLNCNVGGATAAVASQLATDVRFDYLNTRIQGFWAQWLWFEYCSATHVATGTAATNSSRFRLGQTLGGSVLDMPFNAAAFVFARSKELGRQTRQWFGGLNTNTLAAGGLVNWAGVPLFTAFAKLQFQPRNVFARQYTRVIYSSTSESFQPWHSLWKVGQWRAVRRRSLTGSESYSPLT